MNKLTISASLDLPIEAVTQTFAILAKKGSGKTYLGSVMAEEMLEAGQVIVAVDPTGAWNGLRSSADGNKPAYPVVVFGGDHGTLPLSPHAGEIIAQAIVAKRFSAVLDLSLLRKAESIRFVTAFMESLYRLNREPLHLFVDEADDLCPQRMQGDEARMVGAVEDVVKRGRKRGIGCTLITQRPADLNKQVLTQCEVLIALNISHPKDIAPINEWVRVHADDKEAKKMIGDLPTLPKGEGWIWSPSWLHLFERIKIRKRRTFDSGATPEVGQVRHAPKRLAEVDVSALGDQMAALAEEAKSNDPRELKRRIEELSRALEKANTTELKVDDSVALTKAGFESGWKSAIDKMHWFMGNTVLWNKAGALVGELFKNELDTCLTPGDVPSPPTLPTNPAEWGAKFEALGMPSSARIPTLTRVNGKLVNTPVKIEDDLTRYQKDLLTVALSRTPIPTPLAHLAGLAHKSNKSSAFMPNVRVLEQLCLITETTRGYVATDSAFKRYAQELIGGTNAVPTNGRDALQYWLKKLPTYESNILLAFLELPHKVVAESIAHKAGYTTTSSAFRPALRNLEELQFIERDDGNYYSLGKMFT